MTCDNCNNNIDYRNSRDYKIDEILIRLDEIKYYQYNNDIFNTRKYILEEELRLLKEQNDT